MERARQITLTGEPSTAYALKKNGVPVLLIDCGAGVGRSASALLGDLPKDIFISHNHADHTGDLPLYIVTRKDRKHRIFGHPSVLKTVREHRLDELPSVGVNPNTDVDWQPADDGNWFEFADLEFELFRTDHAYECYGFMMYFDGQPLLGWTADSKYDQEIYSKVSKAPIVVAHGRDAPSGDHASFEEIDAHARGAIETQYHVAHYEKTDFAFRSGNVMLLKTGDEIGLF